MVKQTLRDAGLTGDVVDGDIVVGLFAEQPKTELNQLLAPLVELKALCSRRFGITRLYSGTIADR